MRPDCSNLRQLAQAAAVAGGQAAARYFRREYRVELKPDRSEVSEADLAAQQAVIDVIRAARPGDAFIGEETLAADVRDGRRAGTEPVCWVIDPIDGTRNFVRGVPLYACSVAAVVDGMPVAGAIYSPAGDELHAASSDEPLLVGAGAGGSVSPWAPGRGAPGVQRDLNPKAVVAIPSSVRGEAHAIAHRWVDQYVTRSLGAATLHLVYVATGQLQGLLFSDTRLWDLAAGWLLLRRGGGLLTRLDGRELFPLDIAEYRGEAIAAIGACSPEWYARLAG